MGNKRGAISKAEEQYIRDNYRTLSPAQMAAHLKRTEEAVRMWLIDIIQVPPDDRMTQESVDRIALEKELINSPEWAVLKQEFTADELKYFKHRYAKLMVQFNKEEVLATEETQVFLMIKYEILMNRNMMDAKNGVEDIARLEKMLQDTYDKYDDSSEMDSNTKDFVLNLENQLLSARSAKQAKSTEFVKLTEKHSALMKELKATRDQRINKIENLKETFLDIIKELQKEEAQAREGRHMGLMDVAIEKERIRLSQLHEYDDGGIDQPFLTPESVLNE